MRGWCQGRTLIGFGLWAHETNRTALFIMESFDNAHSMALTSQLLPCFLPQSAGSNAAMMPGEIPGWRSRFT